MISMIIAADEKGGIGYKNGLPWPRILDERIAQLTYNGVLVMGSNTWNSQYPKCASQSKVSYVISSKDHSAFPGCFDSYDPNENTIEEILVSIEFRHPGKEIFVIGGKTLFDVAHEYCDTIYVSRIKDEYRADTYCDIDKLTWGFSLQSRFWTASDPHTPSVVHETWEKK